MSEVRSAQELLPWLVPLSEGLIACKDSSVLACFEFEGIDADTSTEGEVIAAAAAADRLMGALRDLPVTVWWTGRRARSVDYPAEVMPDPVSQMVDDEHRRVFLEESAFSNRHFFSIIWQPERSTASFFERMGAMIADGVNPVRAAVAALRTMISGRGAFAWRGAELDRAMQEFEQKLGQLESVMGSFSMRRLRGSELIGFLWAMANPGSEMAPKVWDGNGMLDSQLSERPISVFAESLGFGDGAQATYAAAITLKSAPEQIDFDALGSLLSLPTEVVVTTCLRVMSTEQAIKHIDNVKRLQDLTKYPLKAWISAAISRGSEGPSERNVDPAKERASQLCTAAKGAVSSGDVLFGWHHCSALILAPTHDALDEITNNTLRMFHQSVFVGAIRESVGLLSSWATSLPGQWQECRRWLCLSSVNSNNLAPLKGVRTGSRWNETMEAQLRRKVPALTVFRTDKATPFYFNFHTGGLGHTFIVGPSRSGKSVLMCFLMSQWRKYGEVARTIIFDKDYTCRLMALLHGGDHVDLKPGGSIKINPLLMVSERRHWPFLQRWVEGLISARGHVVSTEEGQQIFAAIEGLANVAPHLRLLRTLKTLIPNQALSIHLEPWIGEGQWSSFFDHAEDSFELTDLLCVEMNDVMQEPRVARAFMDYAFYRIETALTDARTQGDIQYTLIYLEEGWYLLEDATFRARFKNWLKTFAKLNAFVVFTTQSLEDMAKPGAIDGGEKSVFAAIRDNMPTKIYLPNPSATSESLSELYRREFQVREDQIHRIAQAIPKREYFIVQPDVARLVTLELTPRQLAMARSDMFAQRLLEKHWRTRDNNPSWRQDYIDEVLA